MIHSKGGELMNRKVVMVRMKPELHTKFKEAVAYLGTDMTTHVNKLLEDSVEKILAKRDKERQSK